MAQSMKCPNCGAPVRWRGEAPVVACRYCDTHVATGTGEKTQEPAAVRSQMRPRNVAAVTSATAIIPLLLAGGGALIAFLGSQSGAGGILGPSWDDVAALKIDQRSSAIKEAVGGNRDDDTHQVVYFSGGEFDYAVFNWDEDHLDHASGFGLYCHEAHPQMDTVIQWLRHHLGPRFGPEDHGGWGWRWADAYLSVNEDANIVSYHSSPDDDPDWQYRSQLMWSVLLASAAGQDLKLDRATRQRWLGAGYLLSELALLDITTDLDGAVAEIQDKFPGSAVDQSYSLEFEIAVDHPWFRSLELGWENAAGGRIDDAQFWPPARTSQFPDQNAIRDCLKKAYGEPEVYEADHLKKEYTYTFDPKDMGDVRVYAHIFTLDLDPGTWSSDNAPYSNKAWIKLMRTLDRCGG